MDPDVSNNKTQGHLGSGLSAKLSLPKGICSNESQIVAAIKKQESGVPVKEISRELGINQATFYNWKAKYGGMEVSDVKKMKDMEAELSQYKKIVAELTFENPSRSMVIRRQQEAGKLVKDLAREHGISEATFYNWKAKYGGMEANEVKRLKDLEEENSRLKRIVANLTLENDAIKNVLEKKFGGLTINGKRQQEAGKLVKDLAREHGISEATFYNWKAKYGGMEANEVKRLKDLEEENSRLKRIVANLTLENDAIKNVLEKKFGGLTINGKR
ncbi:transposase [Ostertagia ostertagi]